jgi:hypothetical protein
MLYISEAPPIWFPSFVRQHTPPHMAATKVRAQSVSPVTDSFQFGPSRHFGGLPLPYKLICAHVPLQGGRTLMPGFEKHGLGAA